jgi:hypothetical protein
MFDKKTILMFIFLFSIICNIKTQKFSKSWIYFTDKLQNENIYQQTLKETDSFTLERRKLHNNQEIDYYDLPVNPFYIQKVLRIVKKKNHNTSKWMNAITIEISETESILISKFIFVKSIEIVFSFKKSTPRNELNLISQMVGDSAIKQINADKFHEKGFYGQNVKILVLDSGFQLTHNVFKNLIVNDTYDFIHNRKDVSNHFTDIPSQFHHGTVVLGLIGGNDSGIIHGTAPKATYLLAKTEDLRSETPIEEDNFVRAIEWGEIRGAQILTASLGYTSWYTKSDYNGIKGVSTKAINIAIQKGMICCIANGNNGANGIGVPADSFYGISVGAVDANGNIGGFSSQGPTADGRIKPEISARGVSNNIIDVLTSDRFTTGSGTSYATPIVAGSIALMLNANPNLTVYQIYHSIISTGSLSTNPNNQYGYGILDVEKAFHFNNYPQSISCALNCGVNGVCFKQACLCFDQQDCGRNKCKKMNFLKYRL